MDVFPRTATALSELPAPHYCLYIECRVSVITELKFEEVQHGYDQR